MKKCLPDGIIHVKCLRLWSHVGVLDHERILGQWFELDFSLWLDVQKAGTNDDLSESIDYSEAIKSLQSLSLEINCFTIEAYSEQILDCLENLYGQIPMKIFLRKSSAPVSGFTGVVAIERKRFFPE